MNDISNSTKKSTKNYQTSLKTRIAYAFGTLSDNLAVQNFLFLGFSFYFTVAGLNVWLVSLGYIIYSIWDAIDDPLIGVISDRTKTQWGRRRPWIMLATIPLCLLMIFIWTPPTAGEIAVFFYFVIMLIIFDLVFTTYTVNFNALWPEMFLTDDDRASVGVWRSILTIIGLAFAFLLPEIFIEDIPNRYNYSYTPMQYVINGAVAAIIVGVCILIMLKFGCFEREEFSKDVESAPNWKDSYKITFRNKAFMIYCAIALAVFIVYGILPPIIPLFGEYVLNTSDPGIILLIGLLVSAVSTPFWMYLRNNFGVRKSYMVSLITWAISLLIFMLAVDEITGYFFIILVGFGLGGSLYLYDQGLAEVIDDDELRSSINVRREGAYYGVVALFNRFSAAINFIVIAFIFSGTGWGVYTPNPGVDVQLGLRFLVGIWPTIIIIIALVFLYFWPIHGERLEENKKLQAELHAKKKKFSGE